MHERRKFTRFPVTESVVCLRYGRRRTMRTVDISLDGLKLEANFDLGISGESIDLAILTNGTKIYCKGRILAIEEFGNKVCARLRLFPTSYSEYRKLADYLYTLYWGRFQKWIIGGVFIVSGSIAYLILRAYFLQ